MIVDIGEDKVCTIKGLKLSLRGPDEKSKDQLVKDLEKKNGELNYPFTKQCGEKAMQEFFKN